MVILLPLAMLTKDPWIFTRLALGIGVLFSFLSAVLLFTCLKQIGDKWFVALIGTLLFFINPQTVSSSLNGLETSVTTLMFSLVLYITIGWDSDRRRKCSSRAIVLGIFLGLLFLGRTDTIFYTLVFFLVNIINLEVKNRLPLGLAVGSMFLLVISPWLIWNWYNFGSVIQSSGFAFPYVLHKTSELQGASTLQMFLSGLELFRTYLINGLYEYFGIPRIFYLLIMSGSFTSIWWFRHELSGSGNHHLRKATVLSLMLFGAGFMLVFVHTVIRWYPRSWYFDQLIWLTGFFIGITLILIRSGVRPLQLSPHNESKPNKYGLLVQTASIVLILGILIFSVFRTRAYMQQGLFAHQIEALDTAEYLESHLAPDEWAAAFNAGIPAFFSGTNVMNLDGAINNTAFEAIRNRDILDFMHRSSITYYCDYHPIMYDFYGPFWGDWDRYATMKLEQDFLRDDVSFFGNHMKVYRLVWK
jgi:hypothetical protein